MNKEERLLKLEEENRRLKAFIEEYFKDLSNTDIPYIDGPGFWEEMAEDGLYDYKEILTELEKEKEEEEEPIKTFSNINWDSCGSWGGSAVLHKIAKNTCFDNTGISEYYRRDMSQFFELLQLDHENEKINQINKMLGTLQYEKAKETRETVAGVMIYKNTEGYSPNNAYTVTIWDFSVPVTGGEVTPKLVRWSHVPEYYFENLAIYELEFLAISVIEQSRHYGGDFREIEYGTPLNLLVSLEKQNLLRDVDVTCHYSEIKPKETRLEFLESLPDGDKLLTKSTIAFTYLNPFDNYEEQYAYTSANKLNYVVSAISFD